MDKKLKEKSLINNIENHFKKFNTFYTTLIILFIILFFWNKFGDEFLGYCFSNKKINNKITKISPDMEKVIEIKKILEKM